MDNRIKALTGIFITLLTVRATPLIAGSNPTRADTTPTKLLYVVEGTQTYLVPYIERKLKNLRRPDSDILLYDSVAGLNILTTTTSIQATLSDILSEAYAGNIVQEFKFTKDSAKIKFSSYLRDYQSVLAIKDTTLQDLVELQFTLYDITDGGANIRYHNSSSVFIDPRSSHYQADVIRCIDQVFEEANRRPHVNLIANRDTIKGTYFLTTKDTLLLEPIIDDESAEADRIYFWTQDSLHKPQVPIEPSKKDQSLKHLQPGSYNLYFKVSNGIHYSITDTVKLQVYTNPRLTISRPHDGLFIRPLSDRLVIQEYLFGGREIEYSTAYLATLDTTHFNGPPPDLTVQISDQKNTIYASKAFTLKSPTDDTEGFTIGEIIGNVDSMATPIKAVRENKYAISFVAGNRAMESNEIKDELIVYHHTPISLLYDVMIFPSDRNGLYHSWINAGAGLDLRLNKFLSAIAIVGTDLAQASFQHFYINLIASFGPIEKLASPFNKLEGGPALLINHDDGSQSTGFKISYNFYSGSQTNLKIGGSFYNLDHVNYFAIHFTGDIFFNH